MYSLVIKFNMPGLHKWPDAPDKYAYLRNTHRHQFYWKICIPVNQANRELEIIDLQWSTMQMIESHYKRFNKECNIEICDFGNMSCESIAEFTAELLKDTGVKCSQVRVLEDNENGATYTPIYVRNL